MIHGIGLLLISIGLIVLSRFADRTVKTELIVLAVILGIITALGAMPVKHSKTTMVPEPMGIIMERQQTILNLPPFRHPTVNEPNTRRAAIAYAACHESDPFAYARSKLHMMQGLELVSDIQKHADQCLRIKELRKRQRNAA